MPGPDGNASESSERQMPNATSSAVTGLPSSHVASSRMVKVHSVKSSLGVPRSVARSGTRTGWPSSSRTYWVSERLRERLLDRVARDGPAAGRVERVGAGVAGQVDRDGPAGGGALDLGGGALTLCVLGPAFLAAELSVLPVPSRCCRRPTTRRHRQRGSEERRQRRARAACSASCCPAFLFCVRAADGVSGDVWIGDRAAQRRVLGSRASRIASPRRLRESTSSDDAEQRLPQVERVALEVGRLRLEDRLAPRGAVGDADAEEGQAGLERRRTPAASARR